MPPAPPAAPEAIDQVIVDADVETVACDGGGGLQAFKEVIHRHVQRDGEFVKTARRDAIGAAFVFLDLLKADADGLSQLLLGEAQKPATATKPLADMEVNGVSHE